MKDIIKNYDLKNIHICPGLKAFTRITNIYNLSLQYDINKPTIFFGFYSINDVNKINNHIGDKYIMFGGNDCNLNSTHRIKMLNSLNFTDNVFFISTSNDMFNRLVSIKKQYNLTNKIFKSNLNLLNINVWNKINILENNVYVYDGFMERTEVYSSDICDNVIDILRQKYKKKINFIRTSDFKSFISQQELFKIYQKCFIGIRLTYHDGSAQTVLEFEKCNIPIIHNQSNYGIKWNNEHDIVQTIEKEYKKNLVSIIVPSYDRFKLLKDTIYSILKQTYKIFEILIINDCSKDIDFKTYTKLEGLDDRIKVYNLENNLGAAGLVRNYGIKKSNGSYIAFCDDDDLWMENKLEKQINILNETNYDMCSTNWYYITNNKKTTTKVLPDINNYPTNITLDFLSGVYPKGNIIGTSTVLLKKNILKYEFSSKKYAEDYGLWLSILNDNKKIYLLNEPFAYYRMDGNNKQSNERNQKFKILIYQGINAYRCYKYTKILSKMGYIVDCCYSYQDFSFHHGNNGVNTAHINKLFKINSYDHYLTLIDNYDILFCVDIIDASAGNIQVGYNNYKNNIKTIYLIGDLFMEQKSKKHGSYIKENEVLTNINPCLVIFSGKMIKNRVYNKINKYKLSNVILNTPLNEIIKVKKRRRTSKNINLVFSTNFTSINNKHHRNLNKIFDLLTSDNRINLYIYCPTSCIKYISEYKKKPNLYFMGTIGLNEMIPTFSRYDVGILYFENIYEDNKYLDISEPNKQYEYYFAQLPILCNISSSFKINIVDKKLGISLDLRKETNLYNKLLDLIYTYKYNKNIYLPFDNETNINIIKSVIKYY